MRPLSLSLLLMMVHNLKTTREACYRASICYNEMQLAKCNIVIGKYQFYTQFLIIVCARFCSRSMWTYLLGFCKITIELCCFQNDLWEAVKKPGDFMVRSFFWRLPFVVSKMFCVVWKVYYLVFLVQSVGSKESGGLTPSDPCTVQPEAASSQGSRSCQNVIFTFTFYRFELSFAQKYYFHEVWCSSSYMVWSLLSLS